MTIILFAKRLFGERFQSVGEGTDISTISIRGKHSDREIDCDEVIKLFYAKGLRRISNLLRSFRGILFFLCLLHKFRFQTHGAKALNPAVDVMVAIVIGESYVLNFCASL